MTKILSLVDTPKVGVKHLANYTFTFLASGFLLLASLQVKAQRGREHDDHDRQYNNRNDDRRDNQRDRDRGRGNDYDRGRRNDRVVVVDRSRPNWQYNNLPRRNTYINTVPTAAIAINFGGISFRYHNGIYYKPYNNTYVVTAPPMGIRVNTIPVGCRRIVIQNRDYYYYNGTYYQPYDNQYTTVAPPIGALVESIPSGYEKLQINGDTYYVVDGIQYRAVLNNGEIWYEVIKINY
ncbi:DUF6515 family protein [Flectobacillus major]|jgi:hypothetical protein|uniref:DUF6515 family protein n=1 Tax=Flectobacillus major TaxID=103 RepID=UPI0004245CB6|nr:DUF6515 family protein [Flectobacillus major]